MAKNTFAVLTASLAAVQAYLGHEQHPLVQTSLTPLALSDIPLLGFGTWNLKESNTSEAVSWAIQTGYRHIDCAAAYYNQYEVGKGIRDGLKKAGLRREDLWITSKLWNDHHGLEKPEAALDRTLEELGIDYLDLWHMHWPVSEGLFGNTIEYEQTWLAMASLASSGKVKHLGVCNFSPDQLEDLINNTSVAPQVHQMELHPYLQQNDWLDIHEKHNIHVTAYSPLAGTNPTYDEGDPPSLLKNKVVKKIAKNRGCTPAQAVLKWGMSRGTSVIPKSIHKDRISENFLSYKCDLGKDDLETIDELGSYHHRYNNPSDQWGVDLFDGLEDSD